MARRYRDAIKPDRDPRGPAAVGPLEDHPPAVGEPEVAIVAIGGAAAFGRAWPQREPARPMVGEPEGGVCQTRQTRQTAARSAGTP